MKQLLILFFLVIAMGTGIAQTCGTKTQAGTACSRKVSATGVKCWQHGGSTKAQAGTPGTSQASATCGAATKAGGQCKNRVKKTGDRCYLHKS